jgi:hypothetical protein
VRTKDGKVFSSGFDAAEFFQDLEPRIRLPEMRLLVAVLNLAIVDFTNPKAKTHHRWEAAKWLFARDRGVMSFWWICQWMSDDPDSLRDRLLERIKVMRDKPTVLISRVDKR